MSLILDALKRAERERHRGHTPDLAQVALISSHEAAPNRRSLLIVGAIAAVVAFLGVLYLLRAKPATTPAAEPQVPAAPIAPVPTPAIAEPEPKPVAPAPPSIAGADVVSLDDVVGTPPPAAPVTVQPLAPPPGDKPEPPADEPVAVEEPVVAEEPPAAPAQRPQTRGGVPRLRDMPPAYRADFPPLAVDVHVYVRDVQKRFVLINGRRYKEGERLAEGPQIVEIVENGIVFDFRGERVLYPARQ